MYSNDGARSSSVACPGWLMTAVAPWGENAEDAYDQGLVELGLGDARLIEMKGAMLPLGFGATAPQPLPMVQTSPPPSSTVLSCSPRSSAR